MLIERPLYHHIPALHLVYFACTVSFCYLGKEYTLSPYKGAR